MRVGGTWGFRHRWFCGKTLCWWPVPLSLRLLISFTSFSSKPQWNATKLYFLALTFLFSFSFLHFVVIYHNFYSHVACLRNISRKADLIHMTLANTITDIRGHNSYLIGDRTHCYFVL